MIRTAPIHSHPPTTHQVPFHPTLLLSNNKTNTPIRTPPGVTSILSTRTIRSRIHTHKEQDRDLSVRTRSEGLGTETTSSPIVK